MILTIVLAVVAIVLFVHMVFDGSTPATASASVAGTSQSGTTAPAAQSRLAAHKAAVKSRVNSSLDPSLRTDLLRASEDVAYNGTGRNIFKAEPDPPPVPTTPVCAQPGGPSHGLRWCSPIAVPKPPPPPPINLKFFGFASKPGEPKQVFLSQGDDIFIAKEGDIVDRRYKVVQIKTASVLIEDVLNNNTQEIALTQTTT
ncbi:MAG TPA: hypothetical protein VFA71_06830 [Terriglobales bacterium]|nr:hypothetical protein [Terriglobales bacterium]